MPERKILKPVFWNAAWVTVYVVDELFDRAKRKHRDSPIVLELLRKANKAIVGSIDDLKRKVDPMRWAADVKVANMSQRWPVEHSKSFARPLMWEDKDIMDGLASELVDLSNLAEDNGIATAIHDLAGMTIAAEHGSPLSIFGEQGGIFAGNDEFED